MSSRMSKAVVCEKKAVPKQTQKSLALKLWIYFFYSVLFFTVSKFQFTTGYYLPGNHTAKRNTLK